MSKRIACPHCQTLIAVSSGADRTVPCPECGRRVLVPPKSGSGPAFTGDKPNGTSSKRKGSRSSADRPKKKDQAPTSMRTWLMAAGGGILALVLIAGLVRAFRGEETEQQIAEDREALAAAFPVNEFPPVAWTFKPAPGPNHDFPETLAVRFPNSFAWEVVLPGPGPEYLSVENIGGGSDRAIHFGRFDLKTGLPAGPSTLLKDAGNSLKPSAVSPNGTVAIGISPDRLLQIYDPGQETPRTIPELSPLDTRGLPNYWCDFAADERLWLLKEGSLVAWDSERGQADVDGERRSLHAPGDDGSGPDLAVGPDRR